MSVEQPVPSPMRTSAQGGRRSARSRRCLRTTLYIALLLLLATASVLLYEQAVRQVRLEDHQRATQRLLDSALALYAAQHGTPFASPHAEAGLAELREALELAGLELFTGPARWDDALVGVADSLRIASLTPAAAVGDSAWSALQDARGALLAALPATSSIGHYVGHAALLLAVLWSFAAVAAFVLSSRTPLPDSARAHRVPYTTDLDYQLTQRLLLELPWGAGSCGAIVMRLDNLEAIANSHGRTAACGTAEAIASALQFSVRQGDVLARASNDAFVILLPDAAPSVLGGAAARLRGVALRHPLPFVHDGTTQLEISVATASGQPGEHLETLIERARAKLPAPQTLAVT